MSGSFNASQLYGNIPVVNRPEDARITRASSPLMTDPKPMYYWLALIGLLIAFRYVYNKAE